MPSDFSIYNNQPVRKVENSFKTNDQAQHQHHDSQEEHSQEEKKNKEDIIELDEKKGKQIDFYI